MTWFFTHVDPGLLLGIFGASVLVLLCVGILLWCLLFLLLKFSGVLLRRVTRPQPAAGEQIAVPEQVAAILSRDLPRKKVAQFLDGFRTAFDGLRIMNAYPVRDLWRYGVAPAVCSLLVTTMVLAGIAAVVGSVAPSIHQEFGTSWQGRLQETGVFLVIIAVSCVVAFLVWLLLQTAFCGYFFSLLVLQVERKIGTPEDKLHEPPLLTQVRESSVDIMWVGFVSMILLPLNIIPLIGSLIAVPSAAYFNSLFAGYEFLDYPLIARGQLRKDRRAFAKRYRWFTHGLGAFVLLVMLIPGVGAMLLCTAATGSVALHHRLRKNETVDAA